jgi:heptosyltransferase-2
MPAVHDSKKANDFKRILVRATNWVGDAVMCLPALCALRASYPEAHIAVLARPWVADIYEREPFADAVILLNSARGARDLAGKWQAARDLHRGNYDCAVLLQNAFEAALITWLARIPRRIGYDRDRRGFLLTDAIAVPKAGEVPRHERFYYLELLSRAGLISGSAPSAEIKLEGARQARESGMPRLLAAGLPRRVIGVSPGAAFGGAKRWFPERFADAAARIAQDLHGGVAVFGSASESELCGRVAALTRQQGVLAHNFAGATRLRDFVEMVAACDLYLTNDSGAMHISSALGVPTVAIFGATDDTTTGPTGAHAAIVRELVDCSPCLLRECPADHICMERVTADRVVEAARLLLQKTSN